MDSCVYTIEILCQQSEIDSDFFFFTENGVGETKTEDEKTMCLQRVQKSLSWLCGLETTSQTSSLKNTEEQLLGVASLEETTRAKTILHINFAVVVAVGIGLFAYFTVDPFPEGFDPTKYIPKASG